MPETSANDIQDLWALYQTTKAQLVSTGVVKAAVLSLLTRRQRG